MKTSTIILGCILIGLCSCVSDGHKTGDTHDTVVVHTTMPPLKVPDKPQMDLMTPDEIAEYSKLSPGLRAKLEGNNLKLKEYAIQLKAAIDTYNSFAATHNENGSGIQVQQIAPAVKGKEKK